MSTLPLCEVCSAPSLTIYAQQTLRCKERTFLCLSCLDALLSIKRSVKERLVEMKISGDDDGHHKLCMAADQFLRC